MTQHMQDNGFWDRFLFTNETQRLDISQIRYFEDVSNTYDSYVTGLYETIQSATQFDDENASRFYRMNRGVRLLV
jgi:hypothetical protein